MSIEKEKSREPNKRKSAKLDMNLRPHKKCQQDDPVIDRIIRNQSMETLTKGFAEGPLQSLGNIRINEDEDYFKRKIGEGWIKRDKPIIEAEDRTNKEYLRQMMISTFFAYQINNSDWLGEDARAVLVSDIDRLDSGDDLLIEFFDKEKNELVHLVADVTFQGDKGKGGNIARSRDNIWRRKGMETIRYFVPIQKNIQSTHQKEWESAVIDSVRKTPKSTSRIDRIPIKTIGIPRVVIGLDNEVLSRLISYWVKKEDLKGSDYQIIILEEIAQQLEKYIELARPLGIRKIIDDHIRLLDIIRDVEYRKLEDNGYVAPSDYFTALGVQINPKGTMGSPDIIYSAINAYLNDEKFMGGHRTRMD